jgi:hypothetical protein
VAQDGLRGTAAGEGRDRPQGVERAEPAQEDLRRAVAVEVGGGQGLGAAGKARAQLAEPALAVEVEAVERARCVGLAARGDQEEDGLRAFAALSHQAGDDRPGKHRLEALAVAGPGVGEAERGRRPLAALLRRAGNGAAREEAESERRERDRP